MPHTFFELFAGAGGMSLGLETAGWHCAGHAEIEKFPRAVLAHRWPDTPLLGDVTQLTGEQIGPVTLLSGGSPCQDLSIAGKRAGMTEDSGTRSSLFFEQMRLWHESHAPYCLWENVLGAFSSNHGRDFAAVLSAFVGTDLLADGAIHPDRTGKFRWKSAGVASGPTGVAAWRVLDAQYFGVPQRRRRVFVLGTRTGGVDPAEVLALSESVRGDSQTRRTTRQGAPAATSGSTYTIRGPNGTEITDNGCWTYNATEQHAVMAFQPGNLIRQAGANPSCQVLQTLGSETQGDQAPHVIAFKPSHFTRGKDGAPSGVASPLSADADRGDQEQIVLRTARMVAFGEYAEDGTASAIKARDYKDATDLVYAVTTDSAISTGRPRRLTPLECERLMGWPDHHTLVPGASDSGRYKACGNGIASPVAAWIGLRLHEALNHAAAR